MKLGEQFSVLREQKVYVFPGRCALGMLEKQKRHRCDYILRRESGAGKAGERGPEGSGRRLGYYR